MTATIVKGEGWLRTLGFGSSTARYEITIRRPAGAGSSQATADGVLRAEVATMIEARSAQRAVLVLESGRSVAIVIKDLTPAGLVFAVPADPHRSAGLFS
ncbi:hypothetical protein [Ancylobacter pratisalsi]|uniref:Uncharacterized protein n=1 Tax=Ancylobacter pratisalsi TaxID=1745854 RepID=A0A6P1YHD9_9HYPH|nr:hypothetical protein [Ancylobacter pratisalsi]QIB32380.1 hypothetical protein G3A50_00660 [Ancylobacter pratisalsi]